MYFFSLKGSHYFLVQMPLHQVLFCNPFVYEYIKYIALFTSKHTYYMELRLCCVWVFLFLYIKRQTTPLGVVNISIIISVNVAGGGVVLIVLLNI